MRKERPIRYYESFTDDFVETKEQEHKVPDGYEWIMNRPFEKILSGIIYAVAVIFSELYCRCVLHAKLKNKKIMKQAAKTGGFIYINHTQPLGDVFMPALALFPNRIYTVVSPANLSIPFIGKLLPYLGALPIPSSIHEMKKFNEALEKRVCDGHCVIIYPEAHVWEYYTDIRPFPSTSFSYPIKYNVPTYSLSVTYQKRRRSQGRPNMVIYADGPFFQDDELKPRKQAEALRDNVFSCMKKRSELSNLEFIKYREKQK